MLKKTILVSATLLMLGSLMLSLTWGQVRSVNQEQAALEIVSKQHGIPINELQITHETIVNEGGIVRFKVLHWAKRKVYKINLDAQGYEVDEALVQQILAAKRSIGFVGKQAIALANEAKIGDPDELIRVSVWLNSRKSPPKFDPDLSEDVKQTQLKAIKQYHAELTKSVEEFITTNKGKVLYASGFAPIVFAEVRKSLLSPIQSPSLEALPDVETLYLSRQALPTQHKLIPFQPAIDHSTKAINADDFWTANYNGSGIKIAIVEYPDIYWTGNSASGIDYSHVNLRNGTHCLPNAPQLTSRHATWVAGIIGSTHSTNRGVAYGAPAILSGNSNGFPSGIADCSEWAITQGARIINYSLGFITNGEMGDLDRYVDYLVRTYKITITVAAGNIGLDNGTCTPADPYVSTPGLGYNVLTVGGFVDGNNAMDVDPAWTDDYMWEYSCWRNPSIPSNNDREKPELVAPAVDILSTNMGGNFVINSGTSAAAPHVAGGSALLMQKKASLQSHPEEIRAILFASAIHNLEGDKTGVDDEDDDRDGAGGVDLASALTILNNDWTGYTTFTSGNSFPYSFTLNANPGQRLRFAMAWNSNPTTPPSGQRFPESDPLQADLDLYAYDIFGGPAIATSNSSDNSYEIIDFTVPASGTVIISLDAFRFDSTSEDVAWAWLSLDNQETGTPALFRVTQNTGDVFTDGAYLCGIPGSPGPSPPCFNSGLGADIAEYINVSEPVEPADVVELDPNNPKHYRKTRIPYSPTIAGVISTKPGLLMNTYNKDVRQPLALIGRVLVKASAENGPIRPGELLTSSAIPGYAMRCSRPETCEELVIGKALESLETGRGLILMLVMR